MIWGKKNLTWNSQIFVILFNTLHPKIEFIYTQFREYNKIYALRANLPNFRGNLFFHSDCFFQENIHPLASWVLVGSAWSVVHLMKTEHLLIWKRPCKNLKFIFVDIYHRVKLLHPLQGGFSSIASDLKNI